MSVSMGLQPDEEIVHQSVQLRAKHYFNEAIELIENNIDTIDPARRASAWWEAFNVARAKGDTELAKKYILAIDEVDPSAFSQP